MGLDKSHTAVLMQTGLDGITLLRDEATQNKPILALTTGSFAILKWRGTSTTERLGLANPLGRFREIFVPCRLLQPDFAILRGDARRSFEDRAAFLRRILLSVYLEPVA